MTTAREFFKKHALVILTVLLLVLLGTGYALGYRPGPGFTVVQAGTLELPNLPSGATVYADQSRRAVSHGGAVRIALVPGAHDIIIDVKGDVPYDELVHISAGAVTTLNPILVPTAVVQKSLPEEERKQVTAEFGTYQLPDNAHPLILENGCALVSVDANRLVATATTTSTCATPPAYLCVGGTCATTVIFAPVADLRSVVPVPGRQDSVIVAYGSTIAVLKLNPLKPQFFAPIYSGVSPMLIEDTAQRLIAHDDGRTFVISF